MGITKVTATLSDLGKTKPGYEALFLVDTGAVHCLAPKDELQKAGIKPEGKATYELANGQPYEVEYGFARISFMGDETVVRIIFGPENTEPLLGVVALEDVGIAVDPVSRTLKRMPAIPLKLNAVQTTFKMPLKPTYNVLSRIICEKTSSPPEKFLLEEDNSVKYFYEDVFCILKLSIFVS